MDEEALRGIAAQLRQPEGEQGTAIAKKMNEANLHMNRHTIEALQVDPGDHILEIGMGNGLFVEEILKKHSSVRYVGCDFSPLMVREASDRNRAYVNAEQAAFHVASADALPLGDEMFHKVFTVNTIYFWTQPAKVLSEIFRVLRPGGQLLISIRPKPVMEQLPFVKYGFTLFSREELSAVFAGTRFRVQEVVERSEPDQEINGNRFAMSTLIIRATRP